jgi:hypothetical protein
VGQSVDIETSRGDVGRHQYPNRARFEVLERAGPCGLRLVAVDRHGLEAIVRQLAGKTVRAVLGTCEYQHLLPVLRANAVGKQLAFSASIDQMYDLLYPRRGGISGCGQPDRVFAEAVRSRSGVQNPWKLAPIMTGFV